jgi:preprotein translocase subunit SecD
MQKNLRWKFIVIAAVIVIAVVAVMPPSQKIKLGLDLRGGVHLVMQVKTDDALKVETETNAGQLQEAMKTASPAIPGTVKIGGITDFQVEGVPAASEQQFRTVAQTTVGTSFDREPGTEGSSTFRMKPNVARDRRIEAVKQAVLTIEKRVNELGVSEPVVAPYGTSGDQIVVQLPGVTDVAHAKSIIRNTARLEIKLVEGEAPDEQSLLSGHGGKIPDDMDVVSGIGAGGSKSVYLVRKVAAITGTDLANAKVTQDELGLPAVGFTLKPGGVTKFADVTGKNVGRQLAIILDNIVQSAPRIETRIAQPEARITGTFTPQEAQDLALVLRSGALPASLTYQQQEEVGPTLGQDSVRAGILASLTGLVLVTLFMLTYYKLAGINAFVSITLNLLILLGFMAYLGAVMTLPGIAGLILTIGVGVDSNVLIFERIREELNNKKGAKQAVAAGFDRVLTTIIDTHVSSLISAGFLFQFGTGPIRGFATTLFFGLITNVFTAVFVSRALFEFVLSRRPAGSAAQQQQQMSI